MSFWEKEGLRVSKGFFRFLGVEGFWGLRVLGGLVKFNDCFIVS